MRKRYSFLYPFLVSFFCLLSLSVPMRGETVTYTVASTTSVTVTGTAPNGGNATYKQTYSTKEQLTSGNYATLTLSGYTDCRITGITLSMKSNKSAGAGTFSAKAGSTNLAAITTATNFNKWFDNTSYGTSFRDVHVTLLNQAYIIENGEDVEIKITATTNSLYIHSYTCLLYTSPSPRDRTRSRMPSSA